MADRSNVAAPIGRRRVTARPLLGGLTRSAVLSAVRIVVSFMYVCHAAQKMFGSLGGLDGQGASVPVGAWPAWWAGLIELVGGSLILLGLFTRPAALLCSGEMAFAYFTVHQRLAPLPLQNHGEPAACSAGYSCLSRPSERAPSPSTPYWPARDTQVPAS
jgi:putative oxidoreductase